MAARQFAGGMGARVIHFNIAMDAEDAKADAEAMTMELDEMGNAAGSLKQKLDQTSMGLDDVGDSSRKAAGGLGDMETSSVLAMAGMTMVVSGLNQLTGSLYKTIGGLEAAGVINEETARSWQENARTIEVLTGPLEFVISLMILYEAASLPAIAALWAKVPAFSAVTASAGSAAAAIWAFLAPVLVVAAIAFVVIAVIVILEAKFGILTKGVALAAAAWEKLRQAMKEVFDLASKITSKLGALGDAVRSNPINWAMDKAGAQF
tara:strand:- start:2454 stop:3245 length:792 start_codon:yes stop_codon:yes gene_type:complete